MTIICRATPDDVPAMLALQQRAFAEEGRRSGTTDIPPLVETAEAILDHVQNHLALLARDDGRIVGSIRGVLGDRSCVIRALVVDPALQGRGIGSSLLRALEEVLPAVQRFTLTTNMVMEGNVPFYERHGYAVTRLDRFSDKVTLAQMAKSVQ
jgi:predicted N-acetyltransferase YhbS